MPLLLPRLASSILCCFVLLAATSSLLVAVIDAAECTSAQVAELSTLSGNVTAVCGSDTLSSTSRAYCDDSACLAYLTSMVSSVPSCEVESYNLRTVLSSAISSCNAASDAIPASKSGAPQTAIPLLLLLVPQLVVVLGLSA
ncbi:elicitin [Phytophthora sojae]|uniref:Elicitin n=2 Tax=Phytophthora sojae TaxID=67593 RepID=G4ZVT0_PHYSP|nr:elicitin [Phytophthora sojae]ABB56010.1 elicitin-like protein SOL13C [Phytophthora sojae]EGZ11544.1 elicitin [Phytophthora sojae]|eukprot:XP_009531877.1 elicitin [Phytophthora sojae]